MPVTLTRSARPSALALAALALVGIGPVAIADDRDYDGERRNGRVRDTRADYTPGRQFAPVPASSPCVGDSVGKPFVLPKGYDQQFVAFEPQGGTGDLWDMNTQNETGPQAGRYVYRAHELNGKGQLSVTDLTNGNTKVIAERADWERFDGIVWTASGTLLVAEEVNSQAKRDPDFPAAVGGLVYEFFVDPNDPTKLDTNDPRDNVGAKDGVAARPALGAKAHEGQRFDAAGNYYGISEFNGGSIFRFRPDRPGDYSAGQLQALKTPDGRVGPGQWLDLDRAQVQIEAQQEATKRGANGYNRPEDVETASSTGVGPKDTLYVAVTGTNEVLGVDAIASSEPYAYEYVKPGLNTTTEFSWPDNLALDSKGNLAIAEDHPNPLADGKGDDIWIATPPRGEGAHQPASSVQRFASLKDCIAEPTGIYFTMAGTEKWTRNGPFAGVVTDETLLANRQHSGQGTTADQLVAITPTARSVDGTNDGSDNSSGRNS